MSTKPILLDETGKEILEAVEALKNVIAPVDVLEITENGTYDVSEKGTVIVNVTGENNVE